MKKTIIVISVLVVIAGGIFLIWRGRTLPQNAPAQTATGTGTSVPQEQRAQQAEAQKYEQIIKDIAVTDNDLDGLSNEEERNLGTNPDKADTDNDGLMDKDEINIYKTDPLKADTDGDGKTDGYEVRHRTSPLVKNK